MAEASEVRMELAAMGSELLEKMARSPQVTSRLPAVSLIKQPKPGPLKSRWYCAAASTGQASLRCFVYEQSVPPPTIGFPETVLTGILQSSRVV